MSIFNFDDDIDSETLKKYKVYKARCEKVGKEFNLHVNEFNWQIKKNCYICNKQNSGGLDRVDNNLGYIETNIYPCCFDCNRMKSNKSPTQFLEYLSRLNPNHQLLTSFNRAKDYDKYNSKVLKIRKFMLDMIENPDKYE